MILPDQAARERAASAIDTNLIVNAGAGTGKTTLLVDRFLHILFRPDYPCPLSHIVALTFTNKAAREMKVRLRHRLVAIRNVAQSGGGGASGSGYDEAFIQNLNIQYGLTRERVLEVADQAIEEFERAQIVTIHGFAGHLLRLFPVEGQVDPSFQEDEGHRLRQHFEEDWAAWLEEELGSDGQYHDLWRPILTRVSLQEVEALAWAFMDELVPLPEPPWPAMPGGLPAALRQWLSDMVEEARELRRTSVKSGIIEQMLEAAISTLEALVQSPEGAVSQDASERHDLDRAVPPRTTTWEQEPYDRAKSILQIARAMHGPETAMLGSFVSRLLPFIVGCRQRFVESGWVSFSGLLARARTLLREYPEVRREVKSQIGALLVDEFQDTDPVQYELILWLAEGQGQEARDWRSVRLEPGKLFIVGDPKQSIYAFRRADIEAYDIVIQDFVMGGSSLSEQHSLRCNFRSHAGLLAPLNACFGRLFPRQAQKGVQPAYEALLPSESDGSWAPHEGLEVRIVVPAEAESTTEQATREEAEALARWLKEEVIHRQEIFVNGIAGPVKPCHVAVLLRTLTSLRVYLEAFRRYDLPYLTEGEKHFFERQEIRDCLSILRVLAYPHDRMAMVGVLRSPVGGCSDVQITQIFEEEDWKDWEDNGDGTRLPSVYPILRHLQSLVSTIPIAEVMALIFHELPLLELAAATEDGEQAVANLLKLRDLVQELALGSDLNFRELVDQLFAWVEAGKSEGEASLNEELAEDQGEDGAIRVLSIHKAKGLEFPMVIVAGLHRGTDGRNDRVWVSHDWLSDQVGFRMGSMRSLSGIFVESKLTERIRAEQVRLLYVALTRAQRRLVVSSGLPSSNAWKRGSLLSLLAEGLNLNLEEILPTHLDQQDQQLRVGEGAIHLSVTRGRPQKDGQIKGKQAAWGQTDDSIPSHHAHWEARRQVLADHVHSPLFLSPSAMAQATQTGSFGNDQESLPTRTMHHLPQVDNGRVVGIVAHRLLQQWDFSRKPQGLSAMIETCCRQVCALENLEWFPEWLDDLRTLFAKFVGSEQYTKLCEAEILGREVPFAISWPQGNKKPETSRSVVMQGVIDVVYRWQGVVWVADYKTDHVTDDHLSGVVDGYKEQVNVYRQAVAYSMVMEPTLIKGQLIFLRIGQTVEWSETG